MKLNKIYVFVLLVLNLLFIGCLTIVAAESTLQVERVDKATIQNGGKDVGFKLYNIEEVNQNQIAKIIIIGNNNYTAYGIVNEITSNKSNQTFNFFIPAGCGKKQIIISIGSQSVNDELEYQSPIITKCKITGSRIESNNDTKLDCDGTFPNYFISNYNKIDIKFSNTNIQNEINYDDINLVLKLKVEYESSFIEFCGTPIKFIEITPTLNKPIETSITFNQKGGNITITGNHFNLNNFNNTYFKCGENDNLESNVTCLYESNTTLICPYTLAGPKDIKCNLILDGNDINQSTTINYQIHTITNVTNQIIPSKGGIITIIGDQFYDSIDNITINDILCILPKYHNEITISCLLPPSTNNTPNTVYVKVIINGKTSGKDLLIYLDDPKSSSTSSNHSNSNSLYENLKLMVTIIIFIISIILIVI